MSKTRVRQTHEPVLPPMSSHTPQRTLNILVAILAGWMLFGSFARVWIQLHSNLPLDPLPFISFTLACIAIATLAVLHTQKGRQ